MADPRLRWSQVAAPDLTGASRILANANQSFNNAFDTADSVLARYAEGQQEKADNELLTEIASISDEAQLGEFLNSGALQGRNISPAMRDRVLGLRDTVLGYGKDRATTAYTQAGTRSLDGRLAIDQAVEGRAAAEYSDQVATRNAGRGLATNFAQAYGNGQRHGFDPINNANTRLLLARTLQAEAGNQGMEGMLAVGSVIRNRAASGRYGEGIEGVILKPGQFSAWNSRRNPDGSFVYAGGEQGQNMDFTPNEEALAAADAILSGNYEDKTNGATHYYNPAISQPKWGNSNFRRIGDHVFGFGDGDPGASAPVQTQQDAATQFALAAAATGQFSPAQISQMQQPIIESQKGGEARIKREGEEVSNEISSQLILDALTDPSIVTEQALTNRLAQDNPNLTATERLATIRRGQGLAQGTPGLLSPSVLPDLEVDTAIELANQNIDSQLRSTPQNRMIGDISKYREDPTEALTQELGLGSDGENPGFMAGLLFGESGFDKNRLKNLINDYARQLNVTPEVAAVAMREAFVRDPFTLVNNQNTLENRFPIDRVQEIVEGDLSLDQQRLYRRERGVAGQSKAQVQRLNNALQVLMARQAKGEQGLEEQIAILRKSILEFETSNPINAGR